MVKKKQKKQMRYFNGQKWKELSLCGHKDVGVAQIPDVEYSPEFVLKHLFSVFVQSTGQLCTVTPRGVILHCSEKKIS